MNTLRGANDAMNIIYNDLAAQDNMEKVAGDKDWGVCIQNPTGQSISPIAINTYDAKGRLYEQFYLDDLSKAGVNIGTAKRYIDSFQKLSRSIGEEIDADVQFEYSKSFKKFRSYAEVTGLLITASDNNKAKFMLKESDLNQDQDELLKEVKDGVARKLKAKNKRTKEKQS